MNQEIISKPPALYKNLNMQNKPNQPTQAGPKNGIVISKSCEFLDDGSRIQLPPELADLFRDDKAEPQDNQPKEEVKTQASEQPQFQEYNPTEVGAGQDNNDDEEDGEVDDAKVQGVEGHSKKITKMPKNINKKQQGQAKMKRQNLKGYSFS
jgi:hypothetical protein